MKQPELLNTHSRVPETIWGTWAVWIKHRESSRQKAFFIEPENNTGFKVDKPSNLLSAKKKKKLYRKTMVFTPSQILKWNLLQVLGTNNWNICFFNEWMKVGKTSKCKCDVWGLGGAGWNWGGKFYCSGKSVTGRDRKDTRGPGRYLAIFVSFSN